MGIAVVFHRFGPYHDARLAAAAQACGEVIGIELSAETGDYAWQKVDASESYPRVTLFNEGKSRVANPSEVKSRVDRCLDDCAPKGVAIPGWSDIGAFAALAWCLKRKVPAVVMSESTPHDAPRVWWKEFVKRRIVGLYSTALVGGRLHAAYLMKLGMDAERIFTGYDVVDNEHFRSGAEAARQEGAAARARLNLPERYFLASARFIEKKNLPALLHAYADYVRRAGSHAWHLVLLGDGPLRDTLNSQVARLNIREQVHMPGFKQYAELPAYYGLAQAFVHASTTEQWGLVVNEAVASGLPVIVSNRCGCVPELVRPGTNGLTFEPFDVAELSQALQKVAGMSDADRESWGMASLRVAAEHGAERFGEGLRNAAELAVQLPRRHAGLMDRFLLDRLVSL